MSIRPATQDPIRLVGLTLGYDRHPAVHHLSGTVRAGDLLALVGPNGAGKSTLLKGMAGEIRCLEGRIDRSGDLAYMPQADEIDRSFPLSVMDLAGMGLWRKAGSWRSLERWRPEIGAALDAVGLGGFEARPISTLSGGQFRRALFARLILQDCPVVLLDEPFTGIDNRTVDDLLVLIRLWHGQGRTVVAALHDLAQVREHFPTTLLLAREAVAWGPTARVLTPENLARARNLSEAWDEDAAVCIGPTKPGGHDHGPDSHHHHHEDAA
ncbi:ABC transporter ATP-binding protein [Methylobacterium sp. J-072]|uniref:metal ABC transporter ATP-binding protein n=1 Tax=Methylobacterium sp. J-072 TaxID=2836651 RepID=UPI001FB92E3F|nr:ABC transporter ATP-binding protein [Methylobacterium sp. J-072]MCJ2094223.1 ABC transporter ATP-binding protein [Methylobacterium sp. J-072]